MPNPTMLFMRLEGPLQSWGLKSRWDVRDSGDEPTKSGIMGLLGCAMGYPMYDPRIANELDADLTIGVRVEQSGESMDDYHTVTDILTTAEGKPKKSEPSTIVSKRTYLQDASFLVVLEGPTDLLYRIKEALISPKWPIFLGRKSCVPTRPVFEALNIDYTSIDNALKNYPWSASTLEIRGVRPEGQLQCVIEDDNGTYERSDRPRNNPARMYCTRRVRIDYVDMPTAKEERHVPI